MKKIVYVVSFLFIAGVSITSCVKEKNFPVEPKIEFLKFNYYNKDSADCIVSFKDGDGDIGILTGDTTSKDDFRMKYFFKNETTGLFEPYDKDPGTAFDTLFYSYRVPNLTPNGQYKALDGEIKAQFNSAPLFNPLHNVIKFEITLRDRAGHLSNKVTTNEITVLH